MGGLLIGIVVALGVIGCISSGTFEVISIYSKLVIASEFARVDG